MLNSPTNEGSEERRFLTVEEVAATLNYSPERIRQLLRKRRLKGDKLGRKWLIPKEEIDRFGEGEKLSPEQLVGVPSLRAAVTLPARQVRMLRHDRQLEETVRVFKSDLTSFTIDSLWNKPWPRLTLRMGGRPAVRLNVEDRVWFECLKEHKPALGVWPRTETWKEEAAALILVAWQLLDQIRRRSLDLTKMSVTYDLGSRGLHTHFWTTIYASAQQEARGLLPLAHDYEVAEGPLLGLILLRWGAFGLAVTAAAEAARLKAVHALLRDEFAMSTEMMRLIAKDKEVRRIGDEIGRSLDEMLRLGFLDATCRICQEWLM